MAHPVPLCGALCTNVHGGASRRTRRAGARPIRWGALSRCDSEVRLTRRPSAGRCALARTATLRAARAGRRGADQWVIAVALRQQTGSLGLTRCPSRGTVCCAHRDASRVARAYGAPSSTRGPPGPSDCSAASASAMLHSCGALHSRRSVAFSILTHKRKYLHRSEFCAIFLVHDRRTSGGAPGH